MDNQPNLRIVIVSKYDEAGGGASKVAEQLADTLRAKNHVVHHYTRGSSKGFSQFLRPLYGVKTKKLMGKLASKGWVDVIPFELPRLILNINIWRADVIHFHDISGTASPLTITFLSWFKRTFWTLHDYSSITAGCIYPVNCEKYHHGCGDCPQLGKWPLDTKVDRTKWLFKFRRLCLKLSKVKLIYPSTWLANEVNANIKHISSTIINNCVDTSVFRPSGREVANQLDAGVVAKLSHSNKIKILVTSANFDNPYKGTKTALEMIKQFPAEKILLVLMGKNTPDLSGVACEVVNLGYVSQDASKSVFYALVDLLLFCSESENYPLTLLESIACGTSFYALDVGGIKELSSKAISGKVFTNPQKLFDTLLKDIQVGGVLDNAVMPSENISIDFYVEQHLFLYTDKAI